MAVAGMCVVALFFVVPFTRTACAPPEPALPDLIAGLEQDVERLEYEIRGVLLELEEIERTADVRVAQAVNAARAQGADEQEATHRTLEIIRTEVEWRTEWLARLRERQRENRADLESARARQAEFEREMTESPN